MENNDRDFKIDVEIRRQKKKKVKKRYTLRFFKVLNVVAFVMTIFVIAV